VSCDLNIAYEITGNRILCESLFSKSDRGKGTVRSTIDAILTREPSDRFDRHNGRAELTIIIHCPTKEAVSAAAAAARNRSDGNVRMQGTPVNRAAYI